MRLVDADALKNRLHEALEFQESVDNYEGAELFEIAKDIADEQPTIDAIPVEWMWEKIKEHTDGEGWQDYLANSFGLCIEEWRKEQETR